jgi:hypothetical protein
MSAPLYDIFSGHPNENPLWVEAVDSLAASQSPYGRARPREAGAVLYLLPRAQCGPDLRRYIHERRGARVAVDPCERR